MSQFKSKKKTDPFNLTIGNLADFLERYLREAFPGNKVDYVAKDWDRRNDPLVLLGGKVSESYSHPAVYSVPGPSEGQMVHVAIMKKDDTHQKVCWLKHLGDEPDKSWDIAKEFSTVIGDMYSYHLLPRVVDMALMLPLDCQGKTFDIQIGTIGTDATASAQSIPNSVDPSTPCISLLDGDNIISFNYGTEREISNEVHDWQKLAENKGFKINVLSAKAADNEEPEEESALSM